MLSPHPWDPNTYGLGGECTMYCRLRYGLVRTVHLGVRRVANPSGGAHPTYPSDAHLCACMCMKMNAELE
jgi:hypothetical protein